jgi:adenylate cyclase
MLLLAVFLLQAWGLQLFPFLPRLENLAYDYRLRATMPEGVDPRVVIVDLDERSLTAEGRWPWGRDKMARLVDNLFDKYRISLLAFDVVFAEYDNSSGLETLEELARGELASNSRYRAKLEKLRPSLDYDRMFAESLSGRQVVLGYVFGGETQKGLPPPPVALLEGAGKDIPFVAHTGYTASLKELQEAAFGAGFFDNKLVDEDGIFRRVPLLSRYGDGLYESLSLAMIRALYGQPELALEISPGQRNELEELGLEAVLLGGDMLRIPVDERGAVLVPYRGKRGSFAYVSATDVIQGVADPKVLDGVIVLFGATAPGLMDLRATPVQNVYPGVEVHANLIAGMLDQTVKEHPNYTNGFERVALLIIGLLLNLLLPRLHPVAGISLVMGTLVAAIWLNLWFWTAGGIVLPIASQLLLLVTLFLFHSAYSHFIEARSKRLLGDMFGQYVPPEIVAEMSEREEDFGIGGDSREMTVLFSDVRNFTSISEDLEPDELTSMMNAYLTPMTGIIHRQKGTIDKYIGDAVMAFWGAPLHDPEHPRSAVVAALEMSHQMHRVRAEFKSKGWPELHIGIGINTGMMNVGNMGSEFRMAYTVLGDAVNLGSRLEGLTKEFGVEIIVSESTRAAVPDILFRDLGAVRVKGKEHAVKIYEPVGLEEELSSATKSSLAQYEVAITAYRERQWEQARELLQQLLQEEPDRRLYRLYLERAEQLIESPPGDDWDAVITFVTK